MQKICKKKAKELLKSLDLESPEFEKLNKKEIIQELLIYQKELEVQNEEIKLANEQIEKLKEEYYKLFNFAPVGYLVLNEVGIILKCNKTFLNMLELTSENVIDKAFVNFVYEKDKRKFLTFYKEEFKNPTKEDFEIRLLVKNKIIWTLIKTRRDNGNLLLTISDISQLKKEQEKSYIYLEALENAPTSVMITDKNNTIIYVNSHYCEVTGYQKDELIGKNPSFLSDTNNELNRYDNLFDELKKNQKWDGIFFNRRKNGETYIEETRIKALLDRNGEINYCIAIKNDITEKLKSIEKEKDYEKAKALMTVSAGIAHHLNNLNTPIMLTAQMLYETHYDPNVKKNMEYIIKCIERTTKIINSMLSFTKNIRLNAKVINLNSIIQKSINIAKNSFLDIFVYFIPSDERILVNVDEELVIRVILNIFRNSIEAMPMGGKITVRTQRTSLEIENEKKDFGLIEISDTGMGIPNHILPKVFDPFFTTKFMGSSYGLGLSEVKGIIEQHNGLVEIESKVNEGTKVKVYIPVFRETEDEQTS